MPATSEVGETTEACEPPTQDIGAIGLGCTEDFDCPPGYHCQSVNGVVLQQSCQILCGPDCGCPPNTTCNQHEDKTMIPWFQCDPPF